MRLHTQSNQEEEGNSSKYNIINAEDEFTDSNISSYDPKTIATSCAFSKNFDPIRVLKELKMKSDEKSKEIKQLERYLVISYQAFFDAISEIERSLDREKIPADGNNS